MYRALNHSCGFPASSSPPQTLAIGVDTRPDSLPIDKLNRVDVSFRSAGNGAGSAGPIKPLMALSPHGPRNRRLELLSKQVALRARS